MEWCQKPAFAPSSYGAQPSLLLHYFQGLAPTSLIPWMACQPKLECNESEGWWRRRESNRRQLIKNAIISIGWLLTDQHVINIYNQQPLNIRGSEWCQFRSFSTNCNGSVMLFLALINIFSDGGSTPK